jgi:hypothetical protein
MAKPGRYSVPLNQFDMQAGAKALYEHLGKEWHINPMRWEDMTAIEMDLWVRALRAGIIAALETKARKVTRRLLW